MLVRMTFRGKLIGFASLFVFALLLGVLRVGAQTPGAAAQPPATILIIRHAEKLTDGRIDLSPVGFERAKLMPKLFLPVGVRPDLPMPQVLFATHVSAHSNRPVQTVTPLAAALHLPIDDSFSNDDYAGLAAALLSGKYAGKVVLVVWHHGKIPQLVAALGATPPYTPWPDQVFDRIWRIDYANGKATLRDLSYEIMPGDSK
jgi:broad specificity phosphatase PhoE